VTSAQFIRNVIDKREPCIVLFPGRNETISGFVAQQLEIIENWRPYLRVYSYVSTVEVDDNPDTCLLALYTFGNFVAATSRYHFAEHIEAWVASSLQEFHRVMEEEDKDGNE
jgi:hypothetical protein